MTTAEQLFKEMYAGIRENLSLQEICVACMKEYGRQCAEQALKDAAEPFLNELTRKSILSTKILTR